MDRMKAVCILTFFLGCATICNAQRLSDTAAIQMMLQEGSTDGLFRWRPNDLVLKRLAISMLYSDSIIINNKGLSNLVFVLTGDVYDDVNDSLFLEALFLRRVRIDSFFSNARFMRNHFLKKAYTSEQKEYLSFYTSSKSLLYWEPSWMPYYFSFLELEGVQESLLYLKQNMHCLNSLISAKEGRGYSNLHYDEMEIDVCLARLGVLNDTVLVDDLLSQSGKAGTSTYLKTRKNPAYLVEQLSKIRTVYAFQKIGEFLQTDASNERNILADAALAAFLAYVKNFPQRSTKIQDISYMWGMVRVSSLYGIDYSTREYMSSAKSWYELHKEGLLLDMEKY